MGAKQTPGRELRGRRSLRIDAGSADKIADPPTERGLPGASTDENAAQDARSAVLGAMSEREFQRAVVEGLEQRGYVVFHVVDSRLMRAGLPDIIAIKPGLVLLWELKREHGGRIRPEQQRVIDCLPAGSTVDARIVRPSDWDRVQEALR
jgi:hypothetical protein